MDKTEQVVLIWKGVSYTGLVFSIAFGVLSLYNHAYGSAVASFIISTFYGYSARYDIRRDIENGDNNE